MLCAAIDGREALSGTCACPASSRRCTPIGKRPLCVVADVDADRSGVNWVCTDEARTILPFSLRLCGIDPCRRRLERALCQRVHGRRRNRSGGAGSRPALRSSIAAESRVARRGGNACPPTPPASGARRVGLRSAPVPSLPPRFRRRPAPATRKSDRTARRAPAQPARRPGRRAIWRLLPASRR